MATKHARKSVRRVRDLKVKGGPINWPEDARKATGETDLLLPAVQKTFR